MGKYLKKFNTKEEYEAFKEGEEFVLPNVSHVTNSKFVSFHPKPKTNKAGDIAYWSEGKVDTVSYEEWNALLGTPIGVVVVPKGFAPDGKTRICGLKNTSSKCCDWSQASIDVIDSNYSVYSPGNYNTAFENDSIDQTRSLSEGYLSSDKFTYKQSQQDPLTYYTNGSYVYAKDYIRALYYNNAPNPLVYDESISANELQDFNGKSYTETLYALHSAPYNLYNAAYQAYRYSDGASNLQWYLPAIGELVHLMPRYTLINNSLSVVGNTIGDIKLWSSTESNSQVAMYLDISNGFVAGAMKYQGSDAKQYVRPFAIID